MDAIIRQSKQLLKEPEARHWACYATKAAALFLLLGMFAAFGLHMHTFGVALLWVLLSCLSALGYAYFSVVRKASQRFLFETGHQFSLINSGRILAFGIAFAAAAICVFGLFCDVLRWGALDWGIIVSGAIFYPAAYCILFRLVSGQFTKEFRQPGITRAAIWATIAYLCVAFLAASFAAPVVDYPSAYEAFAAAQREFGDSSIELLRQLGILSSVAEGITNWGDFPGGRHVAISLRWTEDFLKCFVPCGGREHVRCVLHKQDGINAHVRRLSRRYCKSCSE